jgi:hypothetical protein
VTTTTRATLKLTGPDDELLARFWALRAKGWVFAGPANDGGAYFYAPPATATGKPPSRVVLHMDRSGRLTSLPF